MTGLRRSLVLRWALIGAALALGLAITPHYGESWDERQFFKYADRALQAYATWPTSGSIPLTGNTYDNYGPAYVMFAQLGARLLGLIMPWSTSDLRHLIYFGTFLAGVWAFYRLCRRWLGTPASLGATLLFATQPIIWGHAFISPKDVPFMSLLLISLLAGLEMVDAHQRRLRSQVDISVPLWLGGLTVAVLVLALALILLTPLFHAQISAWVHAAAAGETNVFSAASDIRTAAPALYVQKFFVLFLRLRAVLLLLLTAIVAWCWRRRAGALQTLALATPPALALGFTSSVRILGPLAAVIIGAYAVKQLGRRSISLLISYALLALFIMYATWPYLWPDPLGHLLESIRVMSQYPWQGLVLFNGALYASMELPLSYLPVLLGIQITEPAWLLIGVGTVIAVIEASRRRAPGRQLLLLALVLFALPLLFFIVTRAPLYDNFRQVLFILPPLFMLAGLAIEKIRRLPLQLALIAVVVLPGIVDGLRLHPYEYIYYNRFVGGELGAFRRFEMDYWGTSYREAADYLNESASANATIWVEGPTHLLQEYSRPDLKIFSTYEIERSEHYDYVVALTRFDLDLQAYPDAPIEHVIQRQGALLTVIKRP